MWGGKELDISNSPVNLSMQKHCCRHEVVISGKKKWGGYAPLLKKCGGAAAPLPPFSYPSDVYNPRQLNVLRMRIIIFKMMFCRSLTVSEAIGSEIHFCKIQPRPSSSRSQLHYSTRLILYTLSADNVRKTREARSFCSLLSNFAKKRSFRIAIHALMEGRCRPIMGARSAWNLLSFKMFSDFQLQFLQVSHPQSFSPFSRLCVVQFSVMVFVHYMNVKYHHIKTTLIT